MVYWSALLNPIADEKMNCGVIIFYYDIKSTIKFNNQITLMS